MGHVYIVQNPMRYDPEQGEVVPRYDISAAERFGSFRLILTPRATIARPEEVIAKMDLILAGFTDNDYLLLIGNPVLIGWATALAASHNGGRVQLLIWSGKDRDYTPVKSFLPIQHTSL